MLMEQRTKAVNKMRTPTTRCHVTVPLMCGSTSRSCSRRVPNVRWNSTYLMLKSLLPHKDPFTTFIQANYPRGENSELLITEEHWLLLKKYLCFLNCSMVLLLYCLVFTILQLMLHYLVKIAIHLNNYSNDIHLRNVIQPMIEKYNKYWRDIPLLYSFAFILDPRAKMKGFAKVLRKLMNLHTKVLRKLMNPTMLTRLALELGLLIFSISMRRNMELLG